MNMKICTIGILTFVWFFQQSVDATRGIKNTQHRRGSRLMEETFYPTYDETVPSSLTYKKTSTIFNVLDFGAKGDGTTDDSKVTKTVDTF